MKLLHVDSSILGDGSVSRQLSARIVAEWHALHPDGEVVRRDLAVNPPSHLSGLYLAAQSIPAEQRNAELQHDLAFSSEMLEEVLAADIIVIGAPMYNFGVPSQLKAWIDRLAVPGKTFRYSAAGPEGLLGAKKVIVASSRGNIYFGTPRAVIDHQEPYLRAIFGFFGITDIEYIRAEGVAISPEHRQKAIESAKGEIAAKLAA